MHWISKTEELRRSGQTFALVTVTECTGSTPREVGAKMIVQSNGTFHGTIGGGHLEQLAIEDALNCIREQISRKTRYPLGAKTGQCCGGVVELFFEILNAGPRLYLFGAGHVGQAICRTLAGTCFSTNLIDEREEWISSTQIPAEVHRYAMEWEDFMDSAEWDATKTYVAIMTYRHDTDQRILEDILRKKRKFRYLGLIGSHSKWERFKQRMRARSFTEEELSQVRCPIGIPLGGGKAPQEIAISLSAELLKIHYQPEADIPVLTKSLLESHHAW